MSEAFPGDDVCGQTLTRGALPATSARPPRRASLDGVDESAAMHGGSERIKDMTQAKAATQDKVTVTKEEMLATRVARYKDLRAFDSESSPAFIDTVIPEFKRDLFSIIGKSVFENAEIGPAIGIAHPFSFGIIKMEPGQGGGLHAHETEEVFFPLNGPMVVRWGDDGENEIELGPWDTITMPIGVMRGFQNPGTETLYAVAIVGGHDGGQLDWHEGVLDRAKQHGAQLVDGELVFDEKAPA